MGKLTKRNILWIVPIGILGVFWYFYGPQKDITDNEYITYVKNYSFENSSKTLESGFANTCKNPYWVYFETQKGQDVVEFKGDCPVNNKAAKVNVQFLVDRNMTNVRYGAMLIDNKMLEEADRDKYLLALVGK
ncbi:glucosamine 6-phosphate synthetase [Lysinibacillus sp. NPDC094177]|uniref:glucosamine 6-phosphate synthetase n=1 Tax=Lysinibacillus sp. NPDC094177 TaxID=3390580 RepID=UPI003CFD674A